MNMTSMTCWRYAPVYKTYLTSRLTVTTHVALSRRSESAVTTQCEAPGNTCPQRATVASSGLARVPPRVVGASGPSTFTTCEREMESGGTQRSARKADP